MSLRLWLEHVVVMICYGAAAYFAFGKGMYILATAIALIALLEACCVALGALCMALDWWLRRMKRRLS